MGGILGATAFGIPTPCACAPGTHSSGTCQVTHWMQCIKPRARAPCLGNRMDEHLAPPCLLFLSLISKSQDHCLPITVLHKWSRLSTLVLKITFCNCSCNLSKQALLPKGMRATSFYLLLPLEQPHSTPDPRYPEQENKGKFSQRLVPHPWNHDPL